MALEIATHALKAMAKGGMYDVVGGGFARYSTDDQWLVPHFEKMLYDNAQLALTYLHAFLLTHEIDLRRVCEETLDFVRRELADPEGGFYSSLDAGTGAGPWTVNAGVNPKNVNRAVDGILAEIERLRAEGITSEELAHGQDFLTGSLALRLETNDGVASTLADIEFSNGAPKS